MIVLFALFLLVSLALIPIGLPGIWLMIAGAIGLGWFSPVAQIGWLVIGGCAAIALVSEVLDFVVASKYTRKFGGSNRGAWGAIIGGVVGALVGVPIPVIGSIIGAIAGSFLGALVAEISGGASQDGATRAATGAAVGRAIAMGLKVAAGLVIAIWLLAAMVL